MLQCLTQSARTMTTPCCSEKRQATKFGLQFYLLPLDGNGSQSNKCTFILCEAPETTSHTVFLFNYKKNATCAHTNKKNKDFYAASHRIIWQQSQKISKCTGIVF